MDFNFLFFELDKIPKNIACTAVLLPTVKVIVALICLEGRLADQNYAKHNNLHMNRRCTCLLCFFFSGLCAKIVKECV